MNSMMADLESESERIHQQKERRMTSGNQLTGYNPPPMTPKSGSTTTTTTSSPMAITSPNKHAQPEIPDVMGSSLKRHFSTLNETLEASERQNSNGMGNGSNSQVDNQPMDPKERIVGQFAAPQDSGPPVQNTQHVQQEPQEEQEEMPSRTGTIFGSIPNMDRIHSYLGFKFAGVKPGSLETNSDFLGSSPFSRVFSRKGKKNAVKTPQQQINSTGSGNLDVPTYGKRAYSNRGASTRGETSSRSSRRLDSEELIDVDVNDLHGNNLNERLSNLPEEYSVSRLAEKKARANKERFFSHFKGDPSHRSTRRFTKQPVSSASQVDLLSEENSSRSSRRGTTGGSSRGGEPDPEEVMGDTSRDAHYVSDIRKGFSHSPLYKYVVLLFWILVSGMVSLILIRTLIVAEGEKEPAYFFMFLGLVMLIISILTVTALWQPWFDAYPHLFEESTQKTVVLAYNGYYIVVIITFVCFSILRISPIQGFMTTEQVTSVLGLFRLVLFPFDYGMRYLIPAILVRHWQREYLGGGEDGWNWDPLAVPETASMKRQTGKRVRRHNDAHFVSDLYDDEHHEYEDEDGFHDGKYVLGPDGKYVKRQGFRDRYFKPECMKVATVTLNVLILVFNVIFYFMENVANVQLFDYAYLCIVIVAPWLVMGTLMRHTSGDLGGIMYVTIALGHFDFLVYACTRLGLHISQYADPIIIFLFLNVSLYLLKWSVKRMLTRTIDDTEAVKIMFPIQFLIDFMINLVFIDVEPFTWVFFTFLFINAVRQILRDTSTVKELWWTIKGIKYPPSNRKALLERRLKLTQQSIVAEWLSVLAVPLLIVLDQILTQFGVGAPSISLNLSNETLTNVYTTYGVLIVVQAFVHMLVRVMVHKKLRSFREQFYRMETFEESLHSEDEEETENDDGESTSNRSRSSRRKSMEVPLLLSEGDKLTAPALVDPEEYRLWDPLATMPAYWYGNMTWFISMVIYCVCVVVIAVGKDFATSNQKEYVSLFRLQ